MKWRKECDAAGRILFFVCSTTEERLVAHVAFATPVGLHDDAIDLLKSTVLVRSRTASIIDAK